MVPARWKRFPDQRRPTRIRGDPTYLRDVPEGRPADPVLLTRNAGGIRYTPAGGGRVLFVRNDNLYTQALNRKARRLEGDPQLIQQGVATRERRRFFQCPVLASSCGDRVAPCSRRSPSSIATASESAQQALPASRAHSTSPRMKSTSWSPLEMAGAGCCSPTNRDFSTCLAAI